MVKALKLPLAGIWDNRFNPDLPNDYAAFFGRGNYTTLWSSKLNNSKVIIRQLHSSYSTVARSTWPRERGFSVRCIKD
jgi:hypothetical protein